MAGALTLLVRLRSYRCESAAERSRAENHTRPKPLMPNSPRPLCSRCVHVRQEGRDTGPQDQPRRKPQFTCSKCGHRGAEVRPDFQPPRMGTGWRHRS